MTTDEASSRLAEGLHSDDLADPLEALVARIDKDIGLEIAADDLPLPSRVGARPDPYPPDTSP